MWDLKMTKRSVWTGQIQLDPCFVLRQDSAASSEPPCTPSTAWMRSQCHQTVSPGRHPQNQCSTGTFLSKPWFFSSMWNFQRSESVDISVTLLPGKYPCCNCATVVWIWPFGVSVWEWLSAIHSNHAWMNIWDWHQTVHQLLMKLWKEVLTQMVRGQREILRLQLRNIQILANMYMSSFQLE